MSTFQTHLPFDLDAIRQQLPKGSTIESVEFDPDSGTTVTWSHPDFVTGYTFALDWSLEQLSKRELPAGAALRPARQKTDVMTSDVKVIEKKPRRMKSRSSAQDSA
jgi:hypothetical protein